MMMMMDKNDDEDHHHHHLIDDCRWSLRLRKENPMTLLEIEKKNAHHQLSEHSK